MSTNTHEAVGRIPSPDNRCCVVDGRLQVDLSASQQAIQRALDQYEILLGLDPEIIDAILSDIVAAKHRMLTSR